MSHLYNTESALQRFSRPLLIWYRAVRRDLPWRRSRDPYHIWISEIMLQQTRVETVIPYYNRFMELFPTVDKLAEAPEEQVLKAWEGLGYYSRARNLQAAAREIVEQYGGKVPDSLDAVSGLKGIGPYTAGAILSIAFNRPEPAVDGNVMRVLSRYFELEEDIAKPSTRIGIEKLAKGLIPEGAAGDFNQALMELGATICTPKAAHCLPCPVMEHCAARLAGRVEELPVKAKAKPPRPERRAVALIEGTGANAGRILVRQRPADGLLARLWELPHVQLPQAPLAAGPGADTGTGPERASARAAARRRGPQPHGPGAPGAADEAAAAVAHGRAMGELAERLAEEDGVAVLPEEWLMNAEHVFSHILWDLAVYRCRLAPGSLPGYAVRSAAASVGAEPGDGPPSPAGLAAAEPPAPYSLSAASPGAQAPAPVTELPSSAAHVPASGQSPASDGLPPNYRWMDVGDMEKYAFPNVFLRILKAYRAV